jgi:hypothetical protein
MQLLKQECANARSRLVLRKLEICDTCSTVRSQIDFQVEQLICMLIEARERFVKKVNEFESHALAAIDKNTHEQQVIKSHQHQPEQNEAGIVSTQPSSITLSFRKSLLRIHEVKLGSLHFESIVFHLPVTLPFQLGPMKSRSLDHLARKLSDQPGTSSRLRQLDNGKYVSYGLSRISTGFAVSVYSASLDKVEVWRNFPDELNHVEYTKIEVVNMDVATVNNLTILLRRLCITTKGQVIYVTQLHILNDKLDVVNETEWCLEPSHYPTYTKYKIAADREHIFCAIERPCPDSFYVYDFELNTITSVAARLNGMSRGLWKPVQKQIRVNNAKRLFIQTTMQIEIYCLEKFVLINKLDLDSRYSFEILSESQVVVFNAENSLLSITDSEVRDGNSVVKKEIEFGENLICGRIYLFTSTHSKTIQFEKGCRDYGYQNRDCGYQIRDYGYQIKGSKLWASNSRLRVSK